MCAYACGCVCVCIGGVSVFMYLSVCVYVSVFLSVFVCVRVFVSVSVFLCVSVSLSLYVFVSTSVEIRFASLYLYCLAVVTETSVNKHLPTIGLETHRFGSLTEIFQALPSLDASVTQEGCTIATSPPCQARNRFRSQ